MGLGKIKSAVEKLSKNSAAQVQTIWDMYFFEHFLFRVAKSKYHKNFVFKGGFLLESMLGVQSRSTMDIDLKAEKINLVNDELEKIFKEIASINIDDEVVYEIDKITDIAQEKKYGGKSIRILSKYYNIKKTFSIDVASGDIVTPFPSLHRYKSKINELEFDILSYTKETILAEKFEALVSKGLNNSRSKDILDMHLLIEEGYNKEILNAALINTFINRQTTYNKNIIKVSKDVLESDRIKSLYENYAKKHYFSKDITFEDCYKSIQKFLNDIVFLDVVNIQRENIEIHLIRHGQDDINKVGGWSSNHLSEEGIREIEALINFVDDDYDLFISSDLNRAKESSLILNEKLKMNIIYDDQFRETNNGDLKDLTKEEFNKKYPGLYYSSLQMDECYPNGESPIEFYNRIKKAFIKLLETNKNKKIILVTHGGVITVINCLINGLPYSNLLKIVPKTGTITKIK